MEDLARKVVMITGAAGNLGTSTTQKFMELDSKLALVDHSADRLQQKFGALNHSTGLYLSPSVELTDPNQVGKIVSKIVDKFGSIDALINIAGGYHAGSPVHETSVETLKNLYELNVLTMFNTCHAVIPIMLEAGAGSIINIGARSGLKGSFNTGAYSASKSGVIRLTESMSAELKRSGIRVNCVLPGTIDTPKNREDMPNADFSRWVTPGEIAEIISFLVSEKSVAVTGASIPAFGKG